MKKIEKLFLHWLILLSIILIYLKSITETKKDEDGMQEMVSKHQSFLCDLPLHKIL